MAVPDEEKSAWNVLTVVNLKKVLKNNNLPSDGLKSVLVQRLVDSGIPFPDKNSSPGIRSSKKSGSSAALENPAQNDSEQPPAEVLKSQKISRKTKAGQFQLEQDKPHTTKRGSSKKPRLEVESGTQNEGAEKLQSLDQLEDVRKGDQKVDQHDDQKVDQVGQHDDQKVDQADQVGQVDQHDDQKADQVDQVDPQVDQKGHGNKDAELHNDLVSKEAKNSASVQRKIQNMSYPDIMNCPTIQIDNQLTPEKLSKVVEQDREGVSSTIVVRNFTRPITLDTVKDALKVYGEILKFWMNKLRTHCFVTFANEEQAIRAKGGLQGIKFPPGIGKILSCEFITREEADAEIEKTERTQPVERVPIFPPQYPPKSYSSKTRSPQRNFSDIHEDKRSSPVRHIVREFKSRSRPNTSLFRRTNARPHIYYTPNAAKYRKYRYSSEPRRKFSRSRSISVSSSYSKSSHSRSDSRSSYSSKSSRRSMSTSPKPK